jgi:hypothetical protein
MMETAFDPSDRSRTVAKEVCKPRKAAKTRSFGGHLFEKLFSK